MDKPGLFSEVNEISRDITTIYLNKYKSKIKWSKSGGSVIDLGFGDGSVTCILKKYVPGNYVKFYACDVNPTMVDYANEHHGDQNITFIVQDVAGELSEELISAFDNVFSFFLFHWVQDQKNGFRNIYEMLKSGGECFLTFFGYMNVYHVYDILGRTPKWSPWLKDIDSFLSPYYNLENSEEKIRNLLEKIGFSNISIESTKSCYTMKNIFEFKKLIRAVDPHKMPDDVFDEFFRDYLKTGQNIGFIDRNINMEDRTQEITHHFKLFIVHASKQ